MNRATATAVLAAVLSAFAIAAPSAPGAEDAEKMDETFAAVATFSVGQDEAPLIAVAELVRRSHDDPKRRQTIEDRLVGLLDAGTSDCKRFVCRQLWMAASKRSVPALTKLLLDDDYSDHARYALERMSGPSAGAALRDALRKLEGRPLVGVINSLGQRRDKSAASLLAPMLSDENQAVVAAAAWSLGRIGGRRASEALSAARSKTKDDLRRVLDDACLLCADTLLADGDEGDASAIYREMYADDEPRRLRIAALRGLMMARPRNAGALGLEAMKDPDARVAASAGALLRRLPGEEIGEALAREMPKLSPEGQVTALGLLAERGGAAARSAALRAAKSDDEAVRLASLQALGDVGGAKDAALLLDAACKGQSSERDAGRESLARLRGADVEAALLRLLEKSEPPAMVELIGVLASRLAIGAVPDLMALVSHENQNVRAASHTALGSLAGAGDLASLLELLVDAASDERRTAMGKTIASVCARVEDKQACAASVLEVLGKAPARGRPALLRLLPTLPTHKSLAALRNALTDADEKVRNAGARGLTEWPNADALDDLLSLAASENETHKVLATRGAARLLEQPSDRATTETIALYARLLGHAARPEEKRLVLNGLGKVGDFAALKVIEPLMEDASVRAEAQAAVTKIARAIAAADHERAKSILTEIAATAANDRVKQEADAAIRQIEEQKDYIRSWMLSGPYFRRGRSGSALFDAVFPPERANARNVEWRPVSTGEGVGLDLKRLIGGDNRAAYLRATVVVDDEQKATLELGSDDGIKAWLNGSLVHANNASRGLRPGEDKAEVDMRPGENVLMLKITNGGGDWGASARIVGSDGKPIPGMKALAR